VVTKGPIVLVVPLYVGTVKGDITRGPF